MHTKKLQELQRPMGLGIDGGTGEGDAGHSREVGCRRFTGRRDAGVRIAGDAAGNTRGVRSLENAQHA